MSVAMKTIRNRLRTRATHPQTPVQAHGNVPDGWDRSTLGDLLAELDERDESLSPPERGSIPVFSLTKRHGLIPQTERFHHRVATEDTSKYKVVRRGHIVYNPYVIWEGAIHALREADGALVSPVYVVLATKQEDGGYLDFLLRTPSVLGAYQRLSSGAVNRRRAIRREAFLSIEVAVPPLEERRAIASVLVAVRDSIATSEEVIAATRQLQDSLREHLFSCGLVAIAESNRIEQGEINGLPVPAAWTYEPLVSASTLVQYGTSRRCELTAKGNPVLRIPNVTDGRVDLAKLKYLDNPGPDETRFALEGGDVLFVRTNGQRRLVGRAAVFQGEPAGALFASYLIRVRTDRKRLLPEFLHVFSETRLGRTFLSGRASAAADGKFNINGQTLKTTLVPLPALSVQEEIVAAMANVSAKLEVEQARCDALRSFLGTLLRDLTSGALRLPNTEAA